MKVKKLIVIFITILMLTSCSSIENQKVSENKADDNFTTFDEIKETKYFFLAGNTKEVDSITNVISSNTTSKNTSTKSQSTSTKTTNQNTNGQSSSATNPQTPNQNNNQTPTPTIQQPKSEETKPSPPPVVEVAPPPPVVVETPPPPPPIFNGDSVASRANGIVSGFMNYIGDTSEVGYFDYTTGSNEDSAVSELVSVMRNENNNGMNYFAIIYLGSNTFRCFRAGG